MRAAVLYQPGTIPTFTDFKERVADDGHDVLEVLLAGLNPVDLYEPLRDARSDRTARVIVIATMLPQVVRHCCGSSAA